MISAKLLITKVLKLKAVDQTFIGMWHSVTSISVLNVFATLECHIQLLYRQRECMCVFVCQAVYMSPQQGSLLLVCSSSGALSFNNGGSPLAGVKYT